MKIHVGLALLAFAAAALPAAADTAKPQQQLYLFNGKPCSVQESSKVIQPRSQTNRNMSTVRVENPWDTYSGCRTRFEWKMVDAAVQHQRNEYLLWGTSNLASPNSRESDGGLP